MQYKLSIISLQCSWAGLNTLLQFRSCLCFELGSRLIHTNNAYESIVCIVNYMNIAKQVILGEDNEMQTLRIIVFETPL